MSCHFSVMSEASYIFNMKFEYLTKLPTRLLYVCVYYTDFLKTLLFKSLKLRSGIIIMNLKCIFHNEQFFENIVYYKYYKHKNFSIVAVATYTDIKCKYNLLDFVSFSFLATHQTRTNYIP